MDDHPDEERVIQPAFFIAAPEKNLSIAKREHEIKSIANSCIIHDI